MIKMVKMVFCSELAVFHATGQMLLRHEDKPFANVFCISMQPKMYEAPARGQMIITTTSPITNM